MTIEQELTPARIRDIARKELERRARLEQERRGVDIAAWAAQNYYVLNEATGRTELIQLAPVQRVVLRASLARAVDGRFLFRELTYSTVKKSGKTTLAGIVCRWMAETQTRFGEIYTMGNDFDQAMGRSFKSVLDSVRMTPGARQRQDEWILPDRWACRKTRLECLTSGSVLRPVTVDPRGEAGANPDLTCWTELWGMQYPEAVRFWAEMTPVPTKPNSLRLVETYAGRDGESDLLRTRYDAGLSGRQLTVREVAEMAALPTDGNRVEDLLTAWDNEFWTGEKCAPDDLVPVWIDPERGTFMYWDSGVAARRMPWQQGEAGARYYREREANELPAVYRQHHYNEWVGTESQFVPLEVWDACREDLPPFLPEDKEPCVLGVDAASTNDCFAIVAVTRHPDPARRETDVAVRAVRRWDPPPGGRINYEEPEAFLRQVCDMYNVAQVAYDPYQMEALSQLFRREGVAHVKEFSQGGDRLVADRLLYDLIVRRRLAHDGSLLLREHVANANVKLQMDEDSKMRICKKGAGRKIDLVVATSMAAQRMLKLIV